MTQKRSKVTGLILALAALLVLSACGPTTTSPNGAQSSDSPLMLGFVTARPGGAWYPIAGAFAEAIQKTYPGSRVDVIQGAGNTNPTLVNDGQADIGIAQEFSAMDAVLGQSVYEKKHDNLSALVWLFEGVQQIVVRKDSDIMSVEDLRGKRVHVGPPGSATVTQVEQLLEAYDMTIADLGRAEYVSPADGGMMLKDGQVDATTPGITGYPVASIMDVAASRDVRVLGISDDRLARLQKINPAYSRAVFPAGVYPGVDEPVQVYKATTILMVRKDLPDTVVTQVLDAIFANETSLKGVHDLMVKFNLESAASIKGLEYHPAAKRYFQEKGALK